jgi:hypothetical protein
MNVQEELAKKVRAEQKAKREAELKIKQQMAEDKIVRRMTQILKKYVCHPPVCVHEHVNVILCVRMCTVYVYVLFMYVCLHVRHEHVILVNEISRNDEVPEIYPPARPDVHTHLYAYVYKTHIQSCIKYTYIHTQV